MELKKIESIIKLFGNSKLTRLKVKDGESEIILENKIFTGKNIVSSAASTSASPHNDLTAVKEKKDQEVISAPLVGTFYTAEAPGKSPFVQPGEKVKTGQTVGIIEAMKMMNEVKAKKDGIVEKVLVADGTAVEFDQPLFQLKD
ncbi:acetyl-CoA carboxylase biotin carboxyl carrier protein [Liquorilactobacillus oeni]|uniref:acetyl-CoA carboxylase biotin carboxyl carrier protein n=1 Tax=Liquorilactobacillus oeni TaxID=303241 RepID=UPI0007093440|nr:acetyl-CoA carboxylase biotin carboxyl carrier protein [Liquorilactobacillus oeni]